MATNECGALTEQVYEERFRRASKVPDSVTFEIHTELAGAVLSVPGRPSNVEPAIGEPAASEGPHGGS